MRLGHCGQNVDTSRRTRLRAVAGVAKARDSLGYPYAFASWQRPASTHGARSPFRRSLLALLTTATLFLFAACQEHAEPTLTPGQKKKVEANLLKETPKPQHAIGAVIENQVKLLGYDLDRTEVDPGGKVTITYYIESLAEKPDDNKIFVHFQGRPNDRKSFQNHDHNPVEGLLPLRKLKKGHVVRDVQVINVRKDFPPGDAHIYWGLWRGDYRLKINNPKDVKNDGSNRVRVAKIRVKGEVKKPPKPKPLPIASATRVGAGEKMTVDGKLDEPVWSRSLWTAWWTPPNGKTGAAPRTRARFAWDDAFLYVGVFSHDADVWSTFKDRDSNTWEQEVIEVFIDADGDRKDYLELQVTPTNVVFDAKFAKHRSDLAKARSWNMSGLKTAVGVDGTVNAREDTDKSWTVEMAIPIAEVPGARQPAAHGQQWRINLFRWDLPKEGRQKAAAFSPPIAPDFHALGKFGRLRFVDPAKAKPSAPKRLLTPTPIKLDPKKLQKLELKPPKSKE